MSPSQRSGCLLGAILRLIRGAEAPAAKLPFRRKDFFFSKSEVSFYRVLVQAVGQNHIIFAKVRLRDLLLELPRNTEGRQSLINRIDRKHVDFVLCDPRQVRPILAIELDDSSHARDDRIERDAWIDRVLRDAGLPILRVPAGRGYVVDDLRRRIAETIDAAPSSSPGSPE